MSTRDNFGITLRSDRPGEHRAACPKCARNKTRPCDGALAVKVEPGGTATFVCHRCGFKGAFGGREVRRRHCQTANESVPAPKPQKPFPKVAADLWAESLQIERGTVAAAYLRGRGCALPHPHGHLRWHPAVPHPEGYRGPTLVALVTDAETVKPMTLHRTWIAGTSKAPVGRPRLLWPGGRKKGGVIRLWPDEEVSSGLAIGEGIETALTAARAFAPVWSLIDAGNLAAFPVLPGIDCLTIIADHDKAGIAAAEECAQRWAKAGVDVRLWRSPNAGEDLNDWIRP